MASLNLSNLSVFSLSLIFKHRIQVKKEKGSFVVLFSSPLQNVTSGIWTASSLARLGRAERGTGEIRTLVGGVT